MRTIALLFLLATSVAFGQKEKAYEIDEFNSIKSTGYIDVEVILGDGFRVVASNDIEMDFNNLTVDLDGLDLKLSIKKGDYKEHPVQVKVYVESLETLTEVKAFGNANITLDAKNSEETSKIKLNAQAGGHIFWYLDCVTVEATVSQGGRIALEGHAHNFEGKVNTGGTIAAMNLEAQNVVAKINAGGEIFVLPIKKLDAKVTAGGIITYRGNPEKIKTKTLGGTIEKMGAKRKE